MRNILPRKKPFSTATVIREAAQYLDQHDLVYGHGTASALDEAAWLVLEAAELSPQEFPDYEAQYPEAAVERAEVFLARRVKERIPAAYIVGRSWFAGLELKVDERALVPRSPIAELITDGFSQFVNPGEQPRILDLCTGGGCIAVATAFYLPQAKVWASDLSEEALTLAQVNCNRYESATQITLVQSNLFEKISGKFDLIVSNPPYVDAQDIASMGAEFEHEPSLGLASGQDGLDITRKILREASMYLKEDGWLIVEVGNSSEALEECFPEIDFNWIEFEHGGDGVFALHRTQLTKPPE